MKIFWLGCLFVLASCCQDSWKWKDKTLYLRLATTPTERYRGLQNSPPLKDNHGMLFVYQKPKKLSFWMKDVDFPIDLAYFDENGKIISIHHMKAHDLKSVPSPAPALFVLEMPENWFFKNNISPGDVWEQLAKEKVKNRQ